MADLEGSSSCSAAFTRTIEQSLEYEALGSSQSIRLLRVHSFDEENLRIYGSLCQVNLEGLTQEYIALSYTWGAAVEEPNEGPDPRLQCDLLLANNHNSIHQDDLLNFSKDPGARPLSKDFRLSLPQNLSNFFKRHHLKLIDDGIYLWIDAICINQTDTAEVSKQIFLMDAVFELANQVWAWLGEEPDDFTVIKAFATQIGPALEEAYAGFLDNGKSREEFMAWLSRFSPIDEHFWEDEMKISSPPASTWVDSWVSYYRFFRTRRWFSRVWIIQEVVLARKVIIVCHNDMIEWEALESLDKLFSRPKWREVFAVLQGSDAKFIAAKVSTFKNHGELFQYSYYRQQLSEAPAVQSGLHTETGIPSWVYQLILLIATTREMQTSVDKDYVFGILGLAKKFFPRDKRHLLQINASDSTADVFSWSCKFLVSYGYLHFLSMVKDVSEKRTPNLPSWVVDWAARGYSWSVSDYLYKAAGPISNPPKQYGMVSDKKLILSGAKIGVVDQIYLGGVTRQIDSREDTLPLTILNLYKDIGWFYKHTEELLEDAIRRTMIMDSRTNEARTQSITAPPDFLKEGFLDYIFICFQRNTNPEVLELLQVLISRDYPNFLDGNSMEDPGILSVLARAAGILTSLVTVNKSVSETDDTTLFKTHTFQRLQQRNFFTTDSGLLGLGLLSAKPGDGLWLIDGYSAPVILRPHESGIGYIFMGEAYVHGAMYGELMTDDVSESFQQIYII
jgi:hypothetical protein